MLPRPTPQATILKSTTNLSHLSDSGRPGQSSNSNRSPPPYLLTISQDSESDSSSSTDSSVELTDTGRCHAHPAPSMASLPSLHIHTFSIPSQKRRTTPQSSTNRASRRQLRRSRPVCARSLSDLHSLTSTSPLPNASPSPAGLMALTAGARGSTPSPSPAITLSPFTRAQPQAHPQGLRCSFPTPGWCLLNVGYQISGAPTVV